VSPSDGVPAYQLRNTCQHGRYRIEKDVIADPQRDTVLQRIRFVPLQGSLSDYRLYVLLAPHLCNRGNENTAWVGDYKGVPMLFAERAGIALALACSHPWGKRSVGFVGVSDGWQDLTAHQQLSWTYSRAENGNVALTGEIDIQTGGTFVLSLSFGQNAAEAGQRARASLMDGFDAAWEAYQQAWQGWQQSLLRLDDTGAERQNIYRTSTAVLRTHEAKRFPGGMIASLSIPWGTSKGDDDLGGYHLVWPRDLAETAGGLLAAGASAEAHRVLRYLLVTQEADGHWAQNTWLDGTPYWNGIQLDETAFPILLADLLWREGAVQPAELLRYWPQLRRAAGFLVCNGPVTQQDRWEEDPGYSPFTLAVTIAALLASAEMANLNHETGLASYLRETADSWNASIERWTYVTDTDLSQQLGVEGYYVRIVPPEVAEAASPLQGFVPIKNRPPDHSNALASHIVSPDALALVRFGLRAADDPRIVNTLKAIDTLLKVDTPHGPAWRRYNEDGYGEHEDGSAFDGTGIGRAWPLLTGERAHYELAADHQTVAEQLVRTLAAFANEGGLLPEQIWDAADIPDQELFCGRPSGSAMPLVWAHAEYLKLRRSLHDGRVFDMPPQPVQRYIIEQTDSPYTVWRTTHKCRSLPNGKRLRIETFAPATVHWSPDEWQTIRDTPARDTGLGVYVADLPTAELPVGRTVRFTLYWPVDSRWEQQDFAVSVDA
jgi:glucoamylase